MQYTAIFHGLKSVYFQMKNCDIFLICAQNIDCVLGFKPWGPCLGVGLEVKI